MKFLCIPNVEIGTVHRYEASGALSGLFRVRCFHQDDAHVFMKPNDIEEEILNVLSLVDEMYSTFGLTYQLELSTRPEKNTIGTDEEWETAQNVPVNGYCGHPWETISAEDDRKIIDHNRREYRRRIECLRTYFSA